MISHEELIGYLQNFQGMQREVVYKAILDSDMLRDAFDSSHGKLVLNNAIEVITSSIIEIVATCSSLSPEDAVMKCYPKCLEVNLAHKLLKNWAKMLIEGDKHKSKIIRAKLG